MHKLILIAAGLLWLTVTTAQGGCQKGNCNEGQGIFRFTDGALYRGEFTAGKFEGKGAITYPDGSAYTGQFRQQLQHGSGTLTDGLGNRYSGMWRAGKRHGKGTIAYADGSTLSGTWLDDKLRGEVAYKYANHDYYVGHLSYQQRSGYGTMRYANGDIYQGQWQLDLPGGKGSMQYAGGPRVAGDWKNGAPATDWATLGYTGPEDRLVHCNEGCPDGPGTFTYTDGTVASGMMIDGKPTGSNTVVFPSGDIYRGDFVNHRPEGIGIMHNTDGRSIGGIWLGGALIKQLMTAEKEPKVVVADYDNQVKVWAVVVGCAFYQHMKTLRYTDDDAYQVYAFLKSIEGGALADDQVKVLIDEHATRENILAAMHETYRQADENDLILFYFSGHGLPGAFLPIDYDGQANALHHDEVHAALEQTRSRRKLVIADACHSGSLASRSVEGDREALKAYYTALTDSKASTALMMSSKGEEISMENGGLRSGVFSHYLIRGLKGEADGNHDSLVSVRELFDYVYREVRVYTGNVQTPTISGNYDEAMPISVVRAK